MRKEKIRHNIVCVCVCVCVIHKREREGERKRLMKQLQELNQLSYLRQIGHILLIWSLALGISVIHILSFILTMHWDLTFLHSQVAENSGLKQEHHDLLLHKGNHRMWPLQHPLSAYTLERTYSTYLCEDHNIPLNSNRSFHHDHQLNTT